MKNEGIIFLIFLIIIGLLLFLPDEYSCHIDSTCYQQQPIVEKEHSPFRDEAIVLGYLEAPSTQ